jgi:hypothetical protein
MGLIFLSYSRDSAKLVAGVVADIEQLGHSVWFDRELSGGQVWWDEILTAIRGCDACVLALTSGFLDSVACRREYSYAAALGKPLLPLMLDNGVSTNLLPPTLAQIQLVDYRGEDRAAGLRLARAIAGLRRAGPPPDPLPDPPEAPTSSLASLAERITSGSTLGFDEQRILLFELRRARREAKTAPDAHALIGQFRKRGDLYASIAEEIDSLPAAAAPPAARPSTPARNRVAVTLVGATIFFVSGLTSSTWVGGAILAVIGAALGAFSGTRMLLTFGMLTGAAAGWALAMVFADASERYIFGGAFGVPLGVILGGVCGSFLKRRFHPNPGNQPVV